ncbi:MAG: DUF58 domain-containing protein [Clostridia bacterium]|nr:DUF58 domain-containing protein [Clostridia bacterium]
MTKEKLIYLAVAIISGVFFILYRDPLAFILFLVILAVPILLFMLTVFMRLGINITIETGRPVCFCGEKAKMSLVIANYSLLPVSQIKVFANYQNVFLQCEDVAEFNFFASPLSKNRYEIEMDSRHAGRVDILFKKARVLDYFGVFSLPLRIRKTVSVRFLPKLHLIEPTLRKNNHLASEATRYSAHKPGDDPTEVFAIREYVDGDRFSRIHWKLTSKQDTYMVKDYSLPINEAVLILPEIAVDGGQEADLDLVDAVLEIAFSLSHTLIEQKTLHVVGYYNAEADKICTQQITDLQDLYSVFGAMFNVSRYYSHHILTQVDADVQQSMTHIVYIGANITAHRYAMLSSTKKSTLHYTVINVVDDDAVVDTDMASEELNIISVKKSRIAQHLNDAVL